MRSKILAYLVFLCFEKRRPKQKCCCLPKVKHLPPPKFWAGYTISRTSNDHADNKKLIIIDTIQLSLLYFFCVTRLGTAKRCQFSVIFLLRGWRKLGCFFCLVPTLVQNFDSVGKTLLQQIHLIQVLTPCSVQSFIILMASILIRALW